MSVVSRPEPKKFGVWAFYGYTPADCTCLPYGYGLGHATVTRPDESHVTAALRSYTFVACPRPKSSTVCSTRAFFEVFCSQAKIIGTANILAKRSFYLCP